MKPARTLLALALLAAALAPAQAQAPPPTDVSISRLDLPTQPTVNVSMTVTAYVVTNAAVTVTVDFHWGDGAWLKPGDSVAGEGSRQARALPGPGEYPFAVTFAPDGTRIGDQTIYALATVTSDPTPFNNRNETLTFVREPRLNLTFEDPATLDVLPGSSTALRFFVRNDGNAIDAPVFTVHAEAPWRARVVGGLLPIEPRASATGVLVVDVPTEAAGPANVTLDAITSMGTTHMARARAAQLQPNATADGVRNVTIEGLSGASQILANETLRRDVVVANRGATPVVAYANATASVPGLNATFVPGPAWPLNLTRPANASNVTLVLFPGERLPLQLWTRAEGGAWPGEGNVTVNVSSVDAPLVEAASRGRQNATATLRLVEAGPDLAVTRLEGAPAYYVGDRAAIHATVRNLGRAVAPGANVTLDLHDRFETIFLDTRTLGDLAPGEAVDVSWSVPIGDAPGQHAVTAHARLAGDDRNASNDAADLRVDVRRPVVEAAAPPEVALVPGQAATLTGLAGGVSVRNLGLHAETLAVELTSDVPWLRGSWTVDVLAGEARALPWTVDVPAVPGRADATAQLRAWVAERPQFSSTANLTIRIVDDGAPTVRIDPLPRGRVGDAARVSALVVDASGVREATLSVRGPGGDVLVLDMARNASNPDAFEVAYTPTVEGDHLLEVRAVDASRDARAGLASLAWNVTPRAYAGLAPHGFSEGATIRERVVRLVEVQEGTTLAVWVDVDGNLRNVPFPYEVSLPWTDGPHVLRARASSLNGLLWERSWNVTLDTLPPQVTEAKAVEAGSGFVDVSAKAQDAEAVTARFETASGVVTARLDPRGGGEFGARLSAPAGWRSLTLVAEDAAGNAASAAVDVGPDRTPGAGLALLVGAVAALALLRRRAPR